MDVCLKITGLNMIICYQITTFNISFVVHGTIAENVDLLTVSLLSIHCFLSDLMKTITQSSQDVIYIWLNVFFSGP